jgi:hypothetical protein
MNEVSDAGVHNEEDLFYPVSKRRREDEDIVGGE